MGRPVSKHVAAAIGLVPAVVDGARRLPAKAVALPVAAIGSALSGIEAAKREYDDLAGRGERLIARLRGSTLDAAHLNGTGAANAKQAAQAAAAQVKDQAVAGAALARARQPKPPQKPAPAQAQPAQAQPAQAQPAQAQPAQAQPAQAQRAAAPEAPPSPPSSATARIDSAATAEVVEQVDKIAANVAAPLITDHDALPLPDYDHMTLGALRGRLRSLDMQQLVQLRDYEKSKADRLPVVTLLDNRIARLANGQSVPSGSPDPAEPPAASKPPRTVKSGAAAKAATAPSRGKVRIT